MPFVHRERVRFGDLDAMRHLNNVVFLRYFETARIAYMRELWGHNPAAMAPTPLSQETAFGLIFAECHINYRSPVYFDEEVAVECSIGEVRRSAFQMQFAMRVDERLAAEGYGWLVGFDYGQEKAAPLPEELRKVLQDAA